MTLQQVINSLERDCITYRNICAFKLKELKDETYKPLKKCQVCNGYSSVSECYEFLDIKHLIAFYKQHLE